MRRSTMAVCAATACSLFAARDGIAQIRGSERAVIGQTIDGTIITIEYSRPSARGREIFGSLVAWDVPWTGANWATTLEADKDIRLNGTEVPAGKYSMWVVPRNDQDWTLFLDPNHKLFHIQKPDSTPEQIRMAVTPETGPHVEMLTWSFPGVSGDAAQLRMQWGTAALPLQIVVQPTRPVALDAGKRALYVGTYELKMLPRMGWPDTGQLEIFEHDGMLRARLPFPIHPHDDLEFDLVPAGTHRFNPGLYRDGKLFNIEMGASFEFEVNDDQATRATLRGIEGTVFGEGTRTAERPETERQSGTERLIRKAAPEG